MNRYPDFYRISRFDIRINEKFDINITMLHSDRRSEPNTVLVENATDTVPYL